MNDRGYALMKTYIFEGTTISSLELFFRQFGEMVNGPGGYFGRDLHSFDDCLFGGFGLENPCEVIWKGAEHLRSVLDRQCLADWCADRIKRNKYLDDEGLKWLNTTKARALAGERPTMFDDIVDTITTVKARSDGKNVIKQRLED